MGQVGLLSGPHDNSLFLPPSPLSTGLLPAPSQASATTAGRDRIPNLGQGSRDGGGLWNT